MPLPTGGIQWPPTDVKPYLDRSGAAQAWWTGDKTTLTNTADPTGGRRRFWSRRKTADTTKATGHYHAPLAADIAAVSADLLFGDEVKLLHDNTTVQNTLNTLSDQIGLENRFAEGAETAAACGGVYLRPAWDQDLADHPLLQVYPHTQAVPDFRYGQLAAVTLWETIVEDGTTVWRHLERHEPGKVLHGLYKGTPTDLGSPTNLGEHPDTADLDPEVVFTGHLTGRLLPAYVPNVLPNRSGPKPLGRADWQGGGVEDLLDALDETWSSLMRDIRLGPARIFVPQEWLRAAGLAPGSTATIDVDQEAVTGVNMADATEQRMETYQGAIRVTEHVAGLDKLTEAIVSACGYSPQTFGLHIDGQASSGTALRIRENKTTNTRSKKQRYWSPALRRVADTLLLINADLFSGPVPDGPTTVGWPELEQDPAEQATWVNTLRTAQAMSIENAVKAAQPHLEGDALDEEVQRIKDETTVVAPFPSDGDPGLP